MISSTRSRESAFRSSTNEASGLTSSSSAPSCSMTIFLSRSYVVATDSLLGAGWGCRPRWAAGCRDKSPEHAVHEASHRVATVDRCQPAPLGDAPPGRRAGVYHLTNPATEQRAVDFGELDDGILRRQLLDSGIDPVALSDDRGDD